MCLQGKGLWRMENRVLAILHVLLDHCFHDSKDMPALGNNKFIMLNQTCKYEES